MESLISSSSDGPSVDSSFMSVSSSGSLCYEIESEVGREALKEICCSALSRVLDFPDCQLETLLGYEEESRFGDSGGVNVAKNITASFLSVKRGLSSLYRHHHRAHYDVQGSAEGLDDGMTASSSSLSFGTPITDTDQVLLLQLMTHMSTFVSKEGFFRKSGNKARIDQLAKGLGSGHFSDVLLQDDYNANDFASVLKQFFSELPEPLLLKRHLDAYLQAASLSSTNSKLQCLQLLMLLLPPVHRVVLQNLLDLLLQVTKYPENKMDSHNLSLIFAPTLFLATRYETLPPKSLEKLFKLLAYMIDNSEEIFEVPSEVHVVAERYCKKKSKRNKLTESSTTTGSGDGGPSEEVGEDSVPIDMYSTSCKRECVENYHESGKERAMDEVAKLYEMVKNMPDGPQKAHFMKRFESASKTGCTPSSVVKKKHFSSLSRLRRLKKKNKENATPSTPKITADQIQLIKPCFKKGPLLSEFDSVEEDSNQSDPFTTTPCRSKENASQAASNFKTPNNFMVPGGFRTPGVCMIKGISTRSPLVTDV